ncbi:MAG TPA: sigma-70 family RNA polymerase sigma factor [Vicinamibacterales bacterium]|nr:sigma-70 family RNA polymerase sigma factor [Vicinamibacterales bacterium]
MSAGHPDAFPATRPSIVRAIRSADSTARERALDALTRAYWRPVYAYIRVRFGRTAEDAQDLTQEFFTRVLEHDSLAAYDPSRARFRTFLRVCLDRFLANEHRDEGRLKRGGSVRIEPLNLAAFDGELARHPIAVDNDPERWFHREWVRGLFAAAVDALAARAAHEQRDLALALFRRYDLDDDAGPERPSYAALARSFEVSVNDVTNQLAWARRTFRAIMLERLRELCDSDEEFRREARDLLGPGAA